MRIQEKIVEIEDYDKFVIITRSRTGSNLLKSLLNSHDDITAHGEYFDFLRGRSCRDVYNDIFPKKSKTGWVGFKLFYNHPFDSSDHSIWQILQGNRKFKIIHLQRKNLLRAHLSKLIADRSKNWIQTREQNANPDKKTYVEIEAMYYQFAICEKHIQLTNNLFKEHPLIEVTYEDLCSKRNETLTKIQDFLGLPHMPLKTNLQKQNPESLEYLITNFSEVKAELLNSKYAFMLKE